MPRPTRDGFSFTTTTAIPIASPVCSKRRFLKIPPTPANRKRWKSPKADSLDRRYNPVPPPGGLVIRVRAKVLGGYEKTDDKWEQLFQKALSRDNLWITQAEHEVLVAGKVSEKMMQRLARFHLVDNTRGEPPMWKTEEIESIKMTIENGVITGAAKLKTENGDREFECDFYGIVESKDGVVTRFDLVAKGLFKGAGKYTRTPPPGKFPFAVSFSLADGNRPGRRDSAPRFTRLGGWIYPEVNWNGWPD